MEPLASENADRSPGRSASADASAPQWKPLTRNQRRVLGVLIEKSKTTPDVYPMSINGIKTGSNQKSNRSPILDLSEHQVEEVLYGLRHLGCVVEVHSSGRVPKYKHQAYDWFAVDKPELGVMAELLLRGEQSVGDLRARVARMEKTIGGLEDLRPILASLKRKNLIVELTSAGRGQMVTHQVYTPAELAQLRQQFASGALAVSDDEPDEDLAEDIVAPTAASSRTAGVVNQPDNPEWVKELRQRMDGLEATVADLQNEVAELKRLIES